MEVRERRVGFIAIAILAAFASWVFLWNLGSSSINVRSDEVIYVRIVQGILHNGDLFPLKHGRSPSFEKPPLKLWLNSLAPIVFGEDNRSFRLLDALLGVLSVFLTVAIAYELFRLPIAAVSTGFLVLMAPEWVLHEHSFRHAVLDGLLVALSLAMALVSIRAVHALDANEPPGRLIFIIAILGSLAVLTKSVAGFVPLACAACTILLSRNAWSKRRHLWPLGIPVIALGLYVVILAVVAGSKGVRIFIGTEIIDRAFTGFQGHNTGDRYFYLKYLFTRGGLAPAYLLLVGLLGCIFAARRDYRYRYLLVWLIVPVTLYSLSSSRTPWYLNPFAPFAAMISVYGVVWLAGLATARWQRYAIAILACTLLAPPYYRATTRTVRHVLQNTRRLEIDRLVSEVAPLYSRFIIIGDALSGRANPKDGRYNVEGIYREMMRAKLTVIQKPNELSADCRDLLLIKRDDVEELLFDTTGLGTLKAIPGREHDIEVLTPTCSHKNM